MIKNICPVCETAEFVDLDYPVVECGLCKDKKEADPKCPQCKGTRKVTLQLRNQRNWFTQGFLYKDAVGFQICKKCGYVNYAPRPNDNPWEKLNKIALAVPQFELSKRKAWHLTDFVLGNEKEVFKSALEINCALGFNRSLSGDNEYFGIEKNKVFAAYAKNVNDTIVFKNESELPKDKKYELIIFNHLEWEQNPYEQLKLYKEKLDDGGQLVIEVPVYDTEMSNQSGFGARNFELLYHVTIQNCFSNNSIRNILKKSGLEIIKHDVQLGKMRMICKKNKVSDDFEYDKHAEIKQRVIRQAQAIGIFEEAWEHGKSMDGREESERAMIKALDIYPYILDGWIGLSLHSDNYKDINKVFGIYQNAITYFPDCDSMSLHFANIFKNAGEPGQETNWIKIARDIYEKIHSKNPYNYDAIMGLYYLEVMFGKDRHKIKEFMYDLLDLIPSNYSAIMKLWAIYNQMEGLKCA